MTLLSAMLTLFLVMDVGEYPSLPRPARQRAGRETPVGPATGIADRACGLDPFLVRRSLSP